MSLSILYVCTGNVCRSPLAELMLRSLAAGRAVAVASSGTHALVGDGIDGASAAALRALGIDPAAHRSRQFEADQAQHADLVLTAEREQRDIVMTGAPTAFRRTFTMREFARLIRHLDDDGTVVDPGDVVARAAALRSVDGEVDPADDDIRDPYRGSVELAAGIAAQIHRTVGITAAALGLGPRPRSRPRPAGRPPRSRPLPGTRPGQRPASGGS